MAELWYLNVLGERWGDVCGSPETASNWADQLLPILKISWQERTKGSFSYFRGTTACLSCQLAAGRHRELLDLIEAAPYVSGCYRKYGLAEQVRGDIKKIVEQDTSPGMFVKDLLGRRLI